MKNAPKKKTPVELWNLPLWTGNFSIDREFDDIEKDKEQIEHAVCRTPSVPVWHEF